MLPLIKTSSFRPEINKDALKPKTGIIGLIYCIFRLREEGNYTELVPSVSEMNVTPIQHVVFFILSSDNGKLIYCV